MNDAFPLLACLGGSAGGLEADTLLLHEIPARTALALVVINHGCRAESFLPHLLACHTKLPVSLAAEGVQVQPGRLYVVPPDRELTPSGSTFVLHGLPKPRGESTVVSVFLESVAREWRGPVVAVILSGKGADGADALQAIKAAGGLTFAQAPDTALCASHAPLRRRQRLGRLRVAPGGHWPRAGGAHRRAVAFLSETRSRARAERMTSLPDSVQKVPQKERVMVSGWK